MDHWFEEPFPGLHRNMVTDLPAQDGVAGATTDATYLATVNFELPDGAFIVGYSPDLHL